MEGWPERFSMGTRGIGRRVRFHRLCRMDRRRMDAFHCAFCRLDGRWGDRSCRQRSRESRGGLAAIGVAASRGYLGGHMSKGLSKVVSWLGFMPLTAQDPLGYETARSIAAKTMSQPGAILPMVVVSVFAMVLVSTGAGFALRELRLANPETARSFYPSVLAVATAFGFVVFGGAFL